MTSEWLKIPGNREKWNARRREKRSMKRNPTKAYLRELKKQNARKKRIRKKERNQRVHFRVSLKKAIAKIAMMKKTRAQRLRVETMPYMQRCILAIDYYYELVRQNTMKAA